MTVTTVVCWLRRRALLGLVVGTGFLMAAGSAQASPLLVENFDNVGALAGSGWALINNSVPWARRGGFGQRRYLPFAGRRGQFVHCSQLQQRRRPGDISNWLISPTLTLDNGIRLRSTREQKHRRRFPTVSQLTPFEHEWRQLRNARETSTVLLFACRTQSCCRCPASASAKSASCLRRL